MRCILITVLMLSSACASKAIRDEAVDPAPWRTPSGREQARIEISERLIDLGGYAEALNLLHAAREEGSDDPSIDLLTGRALLGQGMLSEAEVHLEHARDRMSRDPRPLHALSLVYAETDRPLEAIEVLQEAVQLDPNHAASWNNLGYLLHTVKRDPDAVPALQKAVSLDGVNGRYKRNLGFALFSTGHPSDALRAFTAASGPIDGLYNLGVAYELAGDLTMAEDHYQRVIALDPQHPKATEALERLPVPEQP